MSKKARRSNSGSTPRPGGATFSPSRPVLLPRVAVPDDLVSFDPWPAPVSPLPPSPRTPAPTYGQRSKAVRVISPHPASPRVLPAKPYGFQPLKAKTIQVSAPRKVLACLRRRQRREVLFAKRRAGRSGSAPGPYRRTKFSSFSC